MNKHRQAEQDNEDNIGGERRPIGIDRSVQRTSIQGTMGIGIEDAARRRKLYVGTHGELLAGHVS